MTTNLLKNAIDTVLDEIEKKDTLFKKEFLMLKKEIPNIIQRSFFTEHGNNSSTTHDITFFEGIKHTTLKGADVHIITVSLTKYMTYTYAEPLYIPDIGIANYEVEEFDITYSFVFYMNPTIVSFSSLPNATEALGQIPKEVYQTGIWSSNYQGPSYTYLNCFETNQSNSFISSIVGIATEKVENSDNIKGFPPKNLHLQGDKVVLLNFNTLKEVSNSTDIFKRKNIHEFKPNSDGFIPPEKNLHTKTRSEHYVIVIPTKL